MSDYGYPSSYADEYNPIKETIRGSVLAVLNERTGKQATLFGGRLVWIVNKYEKGMLVSFTCFNLNDRKEAEAYARNFVA
jgi:hypothetical protein